MRLFFSKYKGAHILFWAFSLTFWTYSTCNTYHVSVWESLRNNGIWLILQALLVYAIIYWLMPRYFHSRQYWRFGLSASALWLAMSLLNAWLMRWMVKADHPQAQLGSVLSLAVFTAMTNFYVCFVFIAAKTIKEKLAAERHQRETEKERTENELRFLKSQMNPHFLFNAINSIYVLIRKDQEMAAGTLATFADMLRYQLYECNTETIPVEREVVYLNNYVQLEKLRKGKALQLDYRVGENVRHFPVAPLLLIPFVENAFKYVSTYTGQDNHIRLHLDYNDDHFLLEVENSVEPVGSRPVVNGAGGIGLENVKRRLELIYKGNYDLQITPGDTVFKVKLTIKII
ncbi:GHKL domain-containing protein [Chitinophaga eiseniae]|uniref:GHKL domain-containing protein n=1 Tax=Chitinophaga eiseniae TaxID=634771 RepID=A0A1T4SZ44_9BACT|nr:histidine kinase [Chitinophaga eiseniae]SKA33465.1 GHKL domain-containing protein [Chitinophaga eiseniae]